MAEGFWILHFSVDNCGDCDCSDCGNWHCRTYAGENGKEVEASRWRKRKEICKDYSISFKEIHKEGCCLVMEMTSVCYGVET